MDRTYSVFVIVLAIFAAAAAAPAPRPAPDAGEQHLTELGAGSTTPAGAMKRFVLALKHHPELRMADLVAPLGRDDERFIADYDALTAALARLRVVSDGFFGDGSTNID